MGQALARLRQSTFGLYLLVFTAYSLITYVALWALVTQFTTTVPGGRDTDYFQFHWGYWWLRYALTHGVSPLWTDFVLYPHVSNLSIHTLAAIWYPVYAIIEPLFGQVASVNAMIFLAFPFSATAMFAWLRRRLDGKTNAIAFAGGLAYAFSPYLMTHTSYAHANLIPLWWFPLILLLWDELAYPRHWPRAVTAVIVGLALWGVWLTDLQYLIWLPFAVVGYILWTLWAQRSGGWLALVGWGVLALAIMGALAYIYPLAALMQVHLNPEEYPPAGLYTLQTYSLPPAALFGFAPPIETRTFGHVLAWLFWAAIALMLIVWLRKRFLNRQDAKNAKNSENGEKQGGKPGKWFWLAMAIPPLLMAFGPTLTLGDTVLPMPYLLLHFASHGQYRIPARFTGPTAALLITFLALAWSPFFTWLAARKRFAAYSLVGAACLALLVDVGAFTPYPTLAVPDYPIYHEIAQDSRDYVVMDVPVGIHYGWTGIGKGQFAMYYGAFHHHRMVNGWLSRIPYSTLAYYIDSPLFSWLAGTRQLNGDERQAASDELTKYLDEWPVGYVIAHRDWMEGQQQSEWIGWLNGRDGLCPAGESADGVVIWWRNAALGCDAIEAPTTEIDMGSVADWTHIGEGWYDPENIGGPEGRWANGETTLRVEVLPDTAYELTFSALAFGAGRTVTIEGAGKPIALSSEDWHEYTVTIPADALRDDILILQHNGAESTSTLGLTENVRDLSAAYDWFRLEPANSDS